MCDKCDPPRRPVRVCRDDGEVPEIGRRVVFEVGWLNERGAGSIHLSVVCVDQKWPLAYNQCIDLIYVYNCIYIIHHEYVLHFLESIF